MDFSRDFDMFLKTYKMKTDQLAGAANRMAAILLTNQRAENVKSHFMIQHLFSSPAKTISNSTGTMKLPQRS